MTSILEISKQIVFSLVPHTLFIIYIFIHYLFNSAMYFISNEKNLSSNFKPLLTFCHSPYFVLSNIHFITSSIIYF